tara:strand:+ start:711 stop:935 length:225 start_codon:yes stop_codon:yes gene_type:complete
METVRVIDNNKVEWTATNEQLAREYRNKLLAETDYLALSDSTLSDAMRTYRQELRDVPQQSNFPTSFIIPVKPE